MSRSIPWAQGLILALLATACQSCTPSSSPPTPPAEGPAKAPAEPAPPALRDTPAPKPQTNATAELLAKLQPEGKSPPPAPARSASKATVPTAPPSSLSAEEAAKLPTLESIAGSLSAALGAGDAAAAESVTLRGDELRKLITPAYQDILLGSVEEQNRSIIGKLLEPLRGKPIEHSVKPGPISRAPARGPIAEGSLIMSGATLRLKSGGVAIEVGLDQLILVGEEWKVFRFREP